MRTFDKRSARSARSFWRSQFRTRVPAIWLALQCAILPLLAIGLCSGQENLQPRIILTDQQSFELPGGLLAERTRKPGYRLSGAIIYKDPVLISVNLAYYRSPSVGVKRIEQGRIPLSEAKKDIVPTTDLEMQEGQYSLNYAADVQLKPGLSVFIIQAIDKKSGILLQRRDYCLYYVPLFYRTAWFSGAVGVLIISTISVFLGFRHRRRALLIRRRFNPYMAGAPVLREDLFFGRDRLLARILQTVHNNSIMLFGERRIGKTSIQHHLKKRLTRIKDPKYSFFAVYIDLQGTPQERFFATLRDEILLELESLLPKDLIETYASNGSQYDYREFVGDLRKILDTLSARTDKKVKLVLLIDEIDQLNSYDPRVNQRLRSLFMRNFSENLAAVVSGVAIKKNWEGEGSPWYNFFEEVEVRPFQEKDAEELIKRPIRGVFRLQRGVTDRIISLTGCKPYLIQQMCIELVNRMYEQGRKVIMMSDVEALGRPENT